MKFRLLPFVILSLTLFLDACSSVIPAVQPTYTQLPTYTPYPTYTPIPTYTPTETNTPTATKTPTYTLSPSPTNTPTSTLSPTPLWTPTPSPTPTRTLRPTNTLPPTRTPIPAIALDDIYYNSQHMTDYQFSIYKSEIAGKPISEMATIAGVDEHGRVDIYGDWMDSFFSIYDFCVVVTGVSSIVAGTLNGGDKVYLEATVNRFVGDYDFYNNCEVTLVLNDLKITKK
jgi:hypothetical protein